MPDKNLRYEQINWGWLNDYTGNKFAPITFYDNLYTKDGKTFKGIFEQTIEDIKSGEIIAGKAKQLVWVDEEENVISYGTGSQSHPIYFEEGIPKPCADRISVDIAGNIQPKFDDKSQKSIPNYGILYNIMSNKIYNTKETLPTTVDGIEDTEFWNNISKMDDGSLYSDYILAESIEGDTIIGTTSITSPIFNGNIKFNNPIGLKFTGDINDVTTQVTESNKTFTTTLTLKNSGVTTGTYGQESTKTLNNGSTFIVPYFKVDAKGRITAAGEHTMTMSSSASKLNIKQISSIAATDKYYLTASKGVSGDQELYSSSYVYLTKEDDTSEAVLMGAAWNDYAEYRRQIKTIPAGYCVASNNNGQVYKTTEMYQACDGIVSDTFGFAIGKTDEYQTPLAVSGRVLAYCHGNREDYNAGDTVCAGPEGKVYKMTREEIKEYPDRIVGIVSEIPDYEKWNNKDIDNRIWIKVK